MKRVFWLALCFLALAKPAFAVSTVTRDVSEVDWMLSACIEVVSGSPTVVVDSQLQTSKFFTRCTLDTTTPCCFFVGPVDNLRVTLTSTGSANAWFGGRVSP